MSSDVNSSILGHKRLLRQTRRTSRRYAAVRCGRWGFLALTYRLVITPWVELPMTRTQILMERLLGQIADLAVHQESLVQVGEQTNGVAIVRIVV